VCGNTAGQVLLSLIIFDSKISGKHGQKMRCQVQSMTQVTRDGLVLNFLLVGFMSLI